MKRKRYEEEDEGILKRRRVWDGVTVFKDDTVSDGEEAHGSNYEENDEYSRKRKFDRTDFVYDSEEDEPPRKKRKRIFPTEKLSDYYVQIKDYKERMRYRLMQQKSDTLKFIRECYEENWNYYPRVSSFLRKLKEERECRFIFKDFFC